jgi:hypothetical protein
VALLEKRRYLNNRSGDFPQVILIVPSHVPNKYFYISCGNCEPTPLDFVIGVYSVKIILFIIGQGNSCYLPIGLTNSLILLWNI